MDGNLKEIQTDLENRLSLYFGHSIENISFLLGINPEINKGKLSTYTIANTMLKKHEINPAQYKEKLKSNTLIFKTVRLKKNHTPAESMSFEKVNFQKVVEETWDTSFVRQKFSSIVICFVVFKEINDELIFIGLKVWKMPKDTLENEVKDFWSKLNNIVRNGVEIVAVKIGRSIVNKNNLPGMTDNIVMHVRPKAKDSNDKVALPNGQMITKQAYWLNASYIGKILSEVTDKVKDLEVKIKQQTLIQSNYLNEVLNKDIYTIEDIVEKLKPVYSDISYLDLTSESLKGTSYKLNSPFIVKESIQDVDEYLEKLMLSENYLDINQNEIFDIPYMKRKLSNFENAFKLIKVEPNLYITSSGLKNAEVNISDIKSYIEKVENYISDDDFFTINSLRAKGFSHPIDSFGFDNIFYESLLKRPNKLQSFDLLRNAIFVKSKRKNTLENLIKLLMDKETNLSIDDFLVSLNQKLLIHLEYNYAKQILKDTSLFYSEDLDRLFLTKEHYLDYLYDS